MAGVVYGRGKYREKKSLSIEELQGLAMAECGMSRMDFLSLTPSELGAAMEVWRRNREAEYRERWEQTRLIAAYSVMPHSKKIRKVADLFGFSWEKKGSLSSPSSPSPSPSPQGRGGIPLTREERVKRLEELRERWK